MLGQLQGKKLQYGNTTPHYGVAFTDLFPGLFKSRVAFPVSLVESQLMLDITFSKNGSLRLYVSVKIKTKSTATTYRFLETTAGLST